MVVYGNLDQPNRTGVVKTHGPDSWQPLVLKRVPYLQRVEGVTLARLATVIRRRTTATLQGGVEDDVTTVLTVHHPHTHMTRYCYCFIYSLSARRRRCFVFKLYSSENRLQFPLQYDYSIFNKNTPFYLKFRTIMYLHLIQLETIKLITL